MSFSIKNSKLADNSGWIGGLEAIQGSLNSNQNAIRVEPTTGGTAGTPAGDVQSVQGVEAGTLLPVRSQQAWLSAEMILGTGHVYSNGLVAGPDVGADTTISGCARIAGGTGIIIKARLITNNVLMIGALAQFRVHLYDGPNGTVTAINNFAANTILYANALHRVGSIDFNQFITAGTGSDAAVSYGVFQSGNAACMPFKCAAAQTALSFRVETLAGVTLVTGQKFSLLLNLIQN